MGNFAHVSGHEQCLLFLSFDTPGGCVDILRLLNFYDTTKSQLYGTINRLEVYKMQRILIVEDEEAIANLININLTAEGYISSR